MIPSRIGLNHIESSIKVITLPFILSYGDMKMVILPIFIQSSMISLVSTIMGMISKKFM